MIRKFGPETALLLIDVQVGVDVLTHWGGSNGRRNNPDAEDKMLPLLAGWREAKLQVAFTRHDSREAASPLKFSFPTGAQKPGFEPVKGELIVEKDVNSGFIGHILLDVTNQVEYDERWSEIAFKALQPFLAAD